MVLLEWLSDCSVSCARFNVIGQSKLFHIAFQVYLLLCSLTEATAVDQTVALLLDNVTTSLLKRQR